MRQYNVQLNDMGDFKKTLWGAQLITAEIVYHLPDYPSLLQTYIWQDFDVAPHYPLLSLFLKFWDNNLEGRIHNVRLMQADYMQTHSFMAPSVSFEIH